MEFVKSCTTNVLKAAISYCVFSKTSSMANSLLKKPVKLLKKPGQKYLEYKHAAIDQAVIGQTDMSEAIIFNNDGEIDSRDEVLAKRLSAIDNNDEETKFNITYKNVLK